MSIDQLCINTIRFLSVDAVEKANSGHPGMPMGMAAVGYTLWTQFLKHNPKNPQWPNRDRFVLSAGHGSMLLYSLLHLCGYSLSLEDLKNFRQWGSKTPGHPEYKHTEGVETTTGPLGQGIATAVGMAMAQRVINQMLESPLLDYKIYGIASDGDLMEGISHEACSMAGHLGLNSLIFFYDDNHITIDGDTSLAFSENVKSRFEAYQWNVLQIQDANNVQEIADVLGRALQEKKRPTLIITRSQIGYGSPNKGGTADAHGSPLGAEETQAAKKNLCWPSEPAFLVPDEVKQHFNKVISQGQKAEDQWNNMFRAWAGKNPEKAALWNRLSRQQLPEGWESKLPQFSEDKLATRSASGKVINALAGVMPELLGGSADLAPSNNTAIKGAPAFSAQAAGRNIHFGIREHAMAAALNGMALSHMLIPYGGTFLIFSDYMKGGMRLSALMGLRVIYILTHDSIGLGEDGPTHQPIEQAAQLRAMPNMVVLRPADANETAAAWAVALKRSTGPTCLLLTRQNLPVLSAEKTRPGVSQGAYILSDMPQPRLALIASGSEVALALDAQKELAALNINTRVVSMPSMELFEQQPQSYRDQVLPPSLTKRISIEALSPFGWDRYTGPEGDKIGMTTFGASAPGPALMKNFGFSVDNIVQKAKRLLL